MGTNIGKLILQFAESQLFQTFLGVFHESENEKKEITAKWQGFSEEELIGCRHQLLTNG